MRRHVAAFSLQAIWDIDFSKQTVVVVTSSLSLLQISVNFEAVIARVCNGHVSI